MPMIKLGSQKLCRRWNRVINEKIVVYLVKNSLAIIYNIYFKLCLLFYILDTISIKLHYIFIRSKQALRIHIYNCMFIIPELNLDAGRLRFIFEMAFDDSIDEFCNIILYCYSIGIDLMGLSFGAGGGAQGEPGSSTSTAYGWIIC